jgi:hypothetical protein
MSFEGLKKFIFDVAGIYILWIVIHFICANLYPRFCAELSILGFIKSIFVAEAPHCVAMRWVIHNGGNVIHTMWLAIAVWLTGKFLSNVVK